VPSAPGSSHATPLLRQRMRDVFRHLPDAMAGDVERVHSVRVAARRLRVSLPLLAVRPTGRRVSRAVKRLRQLIDALGISRDLDVTTALLDETLSGMEAVSPEATLLRRRLRAALARARRRMAERLLDLEIAGLRRDLRRVVARREGTLFTTLARLREARESLGREVLGRLTEVDTRYDPVVLHRLRTRNRRLRYTVEVREALKSRAPSQQPVAPPVFKEMQDHLGQVHDAFVLSEWLRAQARSSARRGTVAVAAEAARLAELFRQQSEAHHRAFLVSRPREALTSALASLGRRPAA
jgi:CHAD domain-containing protein